MKKSMMVPGILAKTGFAMVLVCVAAFVAALVFRAPWTGLGVSFAAVLAQVGAGLVVQFLEARRRRAGACPCGDPECARAAFDRDPLAFSGLPFGEGAEVGRPTHFLVRQDDYVAMCLALESFPNGERILSRLRVRPRFMSTAAPPEGVLPS